MDGCFEAMARLQYLVAGGGTRARPYYNVLVLQAGLCLLCLEAIQLCQALLVTEQLVCDSVCS